MSFLILLVSAVFFSTIVYLLLNIGHRERNLPPGPPTIPILGNIHQIPKKGTHFQFTAWAREYGGIYSLKLGTGTAIVLTSRNLVKNLLDKKSSIYSARPNSYVANLISGGDHILLMEYGPQWRAVRKLCHADLAEKSVDERHLTLQEAEARQMVRDYLVRPREEHMLHPKRFSNSVAMSVVWGLRTPTAETSHMERLYSLMEIWSKVMETGATPPVDIYPFLHYLPQSIFLNWVDRATHVRNEMNKLYKDFLTGIRNRRTNMGSRNSLMDRVLDQAESTDSEKQDISTAMRTGDHELWFMGGTLTEGGSDTSASIITAFVQAMTAHPEVQRKAQEQIDRAVGEDRSPQWADYVDLPYVAQCVKETMRWRPVTPLAFPHALTQDDWVEADDGKRYLLPKGSTVILNAWGLHNDPEVFPDPDRFDPDHFAGTTTLAPELANGPAEKRDHYGYGAGRRFCPGAHLAERNLFLAMSKLLWAFDILPARNKKGKMPDLDPTTGYCEGFLVCANDFGADFKVRSQRRRETILREFQEARPVFAKFK